MGKIKNVDVFVVGAGGGAYPAAFRLARAGYRVVMADPKGVLSGNCLAEGCVPSKAIREIAHHRNRQKRFESYGLEGGSRVDYQRVLRHKDEVQRTRYAQHDVELKGATNLALVTGRARFVDARTLVVESDRGEERFQADTVIVASGSDISVPTIPGASLCLTSRDIYALSPSLTTLPATFAIVGGGYIGLETASMFSALGAQVTILELGDHVLEGMDSAMVGTLTALLDPGIRILSGVAVDSVIPAPGGFDVLYRDKSDNTPKVLRAEKVMMATGRHPVIPEGLDGLGVEVGRHGISVDSAMKTAVPHIYAAGDVNGITPLFHAAVRQSLVAANNIMGGGKTCDYFDASAVPTTIFTIPEAAYVGLTPDRAREAGRPVLAGSYLFAEDSRAQILGETGGGITLLFEPGSLRLLGGTVVGVDAANLIGEIGLALSGGLTAYDLARYSDQHPMASEGVGKAARTLF